jgi:hypothetical protein
MTSDQNKQIEEIEVLAAESELIANLAISPQARTDNFRRSKELLRIARNLRATGTEPPKRS